MVILLRVEEVVQGDGRKLTPTANKLSGLLVFIICDICNGKELAAWQMIIDLGSVLVVVS